MCKKMSNRTNDFCPAFTISLYRSYSEELSRMMAMKTECATIKPIDYKRSKVPTIRALRYFTMRLNVAYQRS